MLYVIYVIAGLAGGVLTGMAGLTAVPEVNNKRKVAAKKTYKKGKRKLAIPLRLCMTPMLCCIPWVRLFSVKGSAAVIRIN